MATLYSHSDYRQYTLEIEVKSDQSYLSWYDRGNFLKCSGAVPTAEVVLPLRGVPKGTELKHYPELRFRHGTSGEVNHSV